uniref:Uncharacterized protein n=1 Tax=virus sp. ctah610 TaxID=2826807 RepID=A0A8S5R6K2_9VIRU|nr:MAG TPA: hypothetical protein [virus sp. ctah610]
MLNMRSSTCYFCAGATNKPPIRPALNLLYFIPSLCDTPHERCFYRLLLN